MSVWGGGWGGGEVLACMRVYLGVGGGGGGCKEVIYIYILVKTTIPKAHRTATSEVSQIFSPTLCSRNVAVLSPRRYHHGPKDTPAILVSGFDEGWRCQQRGCHAQ